MRTFARGRLARAIAHLLTAVFLWSVVLTGAAAVPAVAQISTRAATTQTVAVVPFDNPSGFRPDTLGEEASAAVAVELRNRLLLDVLPKADVDLQMRDLGLRAPLSDVDLVRLAAELDVVLVIAGQVRGARIVRGPEGRYAEIVLAVRLFDRIARADVNGALVRARGPASPEASEEVLVEKALQQAAFQTVEQMRSRPTVTAMVLWARGDTVFLNVGTRGGLQDGMKMAAIRGGERIGLVEVTGSEAIGSYAKIIEGPSLRSGDHLRAIFDLPSALAARPPEAVRRSKSRIENILLAAGILFGLGGHAAAARLLGEGNTAFPGFVASNLANGAEMGESGWIHSFWIDGRDFVPTAASYLTWGSYQGTESERLVGVEIWRGGELVNVWRFEGQAGADIIDGFGSPGFITREFTIDVTTGHFTGDDTEFTPWDPDWQLDEETGRWAPSNEWADFVNGHLSEVYIDRFNDHAYYGWFPTYGLDDYVGPYPGVIYQYRLVPILLTQRHVGPNEYQWELNWGEATTVPNYVVATVPAFVSASWYVFRGYEQGVYERWDVFRNPQLNPPPAGNMATFYFYEPIGAWDIVLQVTRSPNWDFAGGSDCVYTEYGTAVGYNPTLPLQDPYNGGGRPPQMRIQDVNLSQVPRFPDSSEYVFYWRIGARSGVDTWPPRPAGDFPEDRGYVWSSRESFDIRGYQAGRAPLLREQRELLSRARAAGARVPRRAATDRILRAE